MEVVDISDRDLRHEKITNKFKGLNIK